MSQKYKHQNKAQPTPIPFNNNPTNNNNYQTPIDQQRPFNQSLQRISSMNDIGQQQFKRINSVASLGSVASINYGQDDNNAQQQRINEQKNQSNQFQNDLFNQQEQLQKVSLQKNQIDQDEILRMFREQDQRKEKRQKQMSELKKKNSHLGHGGKDLSGKQKEKRSVSNVGGNNKDSQKGEENLLNVSKHVKQQKQQAILSSNLTTLNRMTSTKDIKSYLPAPNQQISPYLNEQDAQKLKQLLMQYKIQYRSSLFDTQWQKQRYRLKQQFFYSLCLGVLQMTKRSSQDQNYSFSQRQILQKIKQITLNSPKTSYEFGIFKFCRNLVSQIDIELFVHFHQKAKQPLNKDYKAQYKFLLNNLKDSQNFQLRKKILCKEMDSQMIKVANEIQFFTQGKRKEIRQKQQKLLNEFSADRERNILKSEFDNQEIIEKPKKKVHMEQISQKNIQVPQQSSSSPFNPRQKSNQPRLQKTQSRQSASIFPLNRTQMTSNLAANIASSSKYYDQSVLLSLQQLLSVQQLMKMKKRLQQDLKGDVKQRMIKKFDQAMILLQQ